MAAAILTVFLFVKIKLWQQTKAAKHQKAASEAKATFQKVHKMKARLVEATQLAKPFGAKGKASSNSVREAVPLQDLPSIEVSRVDTLSIKETDRDAKFLSPREAE